MPSNAEVVLATFRAVERRDREALFELYHDEVEFHDASSLPYGGRSRGKAAMREQLETAPETTWLGTWARFSRPSRSGAWIPESSPPRARRSQSSTRHALSA